MASNGNSSGNWTRRRFLGAAGAVAGSGLVGPALLSRAARAESAKNDRLVFAVIGMGGQANRLIHRLRPYGDLVAVCDVDRQHAEQGRAAMGGKPKVYEDYREVLARGDIDAVLIATPDHWHTAISAAALRAGKHVYCEKPLTLTVDEGKHLVRAVDESGKVMQVGTMQRSDHLQFARAVATVRSGQLGQIKVATVVLPNNSPQGGPFATKPVPDGLNWDVWLGQAPQVDYCPERCHGNFRWWYEYSGGIITDWGAHYIDIVHWALDCETSGPKSVDGSRTKLPKIANGFNTPSLPLVDCVYPGGVEVRIVTGQDHGVLFEGEEGRIFVDRGRLTGKPIEAQDADPKLKQPVMEAVTGLFKGNTARWGDHMGNFVEAIRHGKHPVSDVVSQHRVATACHLANISIRLGRELEWDAEREAFIGDEEAGAWLSREPRAGFEIAG